MAVHDSCPPAIVVRPRIANGKPELVGLSRRVAVQGEGSDGVRRPAVHVLGESGVRNHELAVVEYRVTDQSVDEPLDLGAELRRFARELLERLGQAMTHRYVAARECSLKLVLVVARDADRPAVRNQAHHQPQHRGRRGSSVHEVAEKDRFTPVRMRRVGSVGIYRPTECGQELDELAVTPMDVPDDVERSGAITPISPKPLACDACVVDLRRAAQDVDASESLASDVLERSSERTPLISDDVGPEVPVGSPGVALLTHLRWCVEHDGDGKDVMTSRKLDERCPVFLADTRRVDDGYSPGLEALGRDHVEDVECGAGRGLVIRIVGDECAAEVGRHNLGGAEVPRRERRLSRA